MIVLAFFVWISIVPVWVQMAFAVEPPSPLTPHPGMSVIPGGPYQGGGDPAQAYRLCEQIHPNACRMSWFTDEAPARMITIDPFQIDTYEVTQAQFEKIMRSNPSGIKGARLPVERVTWSEAATYCKEIGKRLPTEAEWEKAARGGAVTLYPWGDHFASGKTNHCDRHCPERWRETEFQDGFSRTAPVGSFPANGYGVHDMTGNVYEWVADGYDEDYYAVRPSHNPKGPREGSRKVIRGGSWINFSVGIRPADRTEADPEDRMDITGFRCAR